MEKKENISRRDALKRMSKTAMTVAAVAMLPSVNALAHRRRPNSQYCDKYGDAGYSNHRDYKNYDNYKDYDNYQNYKDYQNCQYK